MLLKTENKNHDPALDLLRITAIFLVVIYHIVGSLLKDYPRYSAQYYTLFFFLLLANCCVNCFAMLSGYLGAGKTFKWKVLLRLYLQVWFYSAGISLVAYGMGRISGTSLLLSFLPVLTEQYWYFTAYFALFFLMPFLHEFIERLSPVRRRVLVGVLGGLFSLLPTVANRDVFLMHGGFSCWWLMILYIAGEVIHAEKEYFLRRRCRFYYAAFFAVSAGVLGFVYLSGTLTSMLGSGGKEFRSIYIPYYSPFACLSAVLLFVAVVQTKIPAKAWCRKLLKKMAAAAFGVYLIHLQPFLWNDVLSPLCREIGQGRAWWLLPGIVLTAGGCLYCICTVLEWGREFLFTKIARIAMWRDIDVSASKN